MRALRCLIDGELALRVGLGLVDQLEAGLRAELVERDGGAGLRLAGGLVDDGAGDGGVGSESSAAGSGELRSEQSLMRHRLHGLAAFAAELQVLCRSRALQCGQVRASTAAAACGFDCGAATACGLASAPATASCTRSTSASTPASSFCRSFLVS